MTLEDVRKLNDAVPFRPYEIHRADGRVARVAHPDFIAFAPSGRLVTVIDEDDRHQNISVSHIVALHYTPDSDAVEH